jgi:hypothetical protein
VEGDLLPFMCRLPIFNPNPQFLDLNPSPLSSWCPLLDRFWRNEEEFLEVFQLKLLLLIFILKIQSTLLLKLCSKLAVKVNNTILREFLISFLVVQLTYKYSYRH